MTGVAMSVTLFDAPLRNAVAGLRAFPEERMTPFLDAVGAAMESSTIRRFDAQQGPGGVLWAPSKRAKKEGGKTLIKSGRLRLSQIYNVLQNAVEWGTNVIYAAMQQFGGTIRSYARSQETFHKRDRDGSLKPGFVKKSRADFARRVTLPEYDIRIPARPYVGVDKGDEQEITTIAERHLGAAIQGKPPGEL